MAAETAAREASARELRVQREHEEAALQAEQDDRIRKASERLETLSGPDFEKFLVGLFQRMGYHVQHNGRPGDFGADVIITDTLGTRVVVQAKRYAEKVGIDAVQEAIGAIRHVRAQRAIVVTTSGFTDQAIALAASNDVELIGGRRLNELTSRHPAPQSDDVA